MNFPRRALAFAICASAACVPAPEDPIDFGTLCIPDTVDCPSVRLLERDVGGRNQVDFIIRNVGEEVALVEALALVPSADVDAGLTDVAPDTLVARHQYDPLSPGDVIEDRFTAQDLGVRTSFYFAVRCNGCQVELEWVFASVPRECFENDDCAAGWQCDNNIGRCVECLANPDCNEDQRCNLQTGRCDPPDTTAGCNTSGSPTGFAALLLFLIALLLSGRQRRKRAAAAVGAALLIVLCSLPASASPPRASVAVGAGARFITGTLGPLTQRGVGLAIGQELRWRHIGAGLTLGTSYFLTRQDPPPFSRSLQTYGATLGPRFFLPLRFIEFVAGGDYRRVGTANNSLVRFTGVRTSFDGVGGFGGIRLRWSSLEVRLEGGGHYMPQLDSTVISTDLSVGFTNAN